MGANMVLVDRSELLCILEEYAFLTALLNSGVDNWSGYSFAQDLFEQSSAELVFNSLERLKETTCSE